MNNKITVVSCSGKNCNSYSISGNNIIIPVLFGVAIGFFLSSRK